MDGIKIRRLEPGETALFKKGIQDAFQKGFEDVLGPAEGTVIPEKDIDESLNAEGSASYVAVIDGTVVGGAIVVIGPDGHDHLDILYVSKESQSKGIGCRIWEAVEGMYPDAVSWETCTPTFDRRNIRFYTEKCGFRIVGTQPHDEFPPGFIGDGGQGMVLFRKDMNRSVINIP